VKQTRVAVSLLTLALLAGAFPAEAQQSSAPQSAAPSKPSAIDDTMEAGEAETEAPRHGLVNFTQYEGPFGTIGVGADILWDYATFEQDANSREQFDLSTE
jgi:hypothetical protein